MKIYESIAIAAFAVVLLTGAYSLGKNVGLEDGFARGFEKGNTDAFAEGHVAGYADALAAAPGSTLKQMQ